MLNKKILAASIAVAFSSSAFAVVDIEADTGSVTFATEAYTATDLNTDGNLPVTNASNILDVTFNTGFTIGNGTSKYVVVTLNNAEFGAAPTLTVTNGTASIAQGGTAGDSTVIFEVAAGADIPANAVMTLAASSYAISTSSAATVSTALYETAGNAVSGDQALYTETGTLATTGTGSSGDFANEYTSTATVASSFLNFDASATNTASATLTAVGEIDITEIVANSTYKPDGTALTAGDLITDAQDVTFAGNFSYGTWTLEDEATCADVGGVTSIDVSAGINTDEDEATVAVASLAAGPYYLCLEVDGTTETIVKSTYDVTLVDDSLENDLGTVKYDTTSIEVPYLTTFADYNQRFFLVNYSNSEVTYTIDFVSEDGVTATDGTAQTGTIPGGEMISIKATDIVTLAGKQRTSAIIEVEAQDADVSASMQIVDLESGTTDTVVLN
ncbi:hypothetical protein [Alteromonas gilva]|uniref:Uncharacterized protein n=1 Tax=Alteromonas gilva TaxID=2987522 RepID=A0ABT5L7J9_9ALTE|nr:hypothetical protein [Alteromonas gilva]MDC8833011.1 hypothetical protein [Alteromonas gilva]